MACNSEIALSAQAGSTVCGGNPCRRPYHIDTADQFRLVQHYASVPAVCSTHRMLTPRPWPLRHAVGVKSRVLRHATGDASQVNALLKAFALTTYVSIKIHYKIPRTTCITPFLALGNHDSPLRCPRTPVLGSSYPRRRYYSAQHVPHLLSPLV